MGDVFASLDTGAGPAGGSVDAVASEVPGEFNATFAVSMEPMVTPQMMFAFEGLREGGGAVRVLFVGLSGMAFGSLTRLVTTSTRQGKRFRSITVN